MDHENFSADNEEDMRQQMLLLSLISYVGTRFTGDTIALDLLGRIEETLARSDTVKDRWDIVWGPAVYHYQPPQGSTPGAACDFPPPQELNDIPAEEVATHMMFAVRSRQNPQLYAVILRGTNGASCVNLWEDTWGFAELVDWPFGSPGNGLKPQFSAGCDFALDKLSSMTPETSVSGSGQTIVEFLDDAAASTQAEENLQIIVAGHSLAGGIAPTVALWLVNTQGADWDHDEKATVYTYAFAGPSAGNSDFAVWSDLSFGKRTHRVWHSLDMPPYKYNETQMQQLPDLFGDDVPLTNDAQKLVQFYQFLGQDKDYNQIRVDQSPFISTVNPDASDPNKHPAQDFDPWLAQFSYQHNYGYLNVLGLEQETKLVEWILGPGSKK